MVSNLEVKSLRAMNFFSFFFFNLYCSFFFFFVSLPFMHIRYVLFYTPLKGIYEYKQNALSSYG